MTPYSIPLWTILTKWPAPAGPQCRKPRSAVAGRPLRPGVRAAASTPGAIASNSGSSRSTTAVLAADHQAVAALESPDAAARADVEVVDVLSRPSAAARAMSSR